MSKKILIEILHPAHVHAFRHAIDAFRARGDEVLVTAREKDVALPLLNAHGIPHVTLSRLPDRRWMLVSELLLRVAKLVAIGRRERPDVLLSIMGPTVVVAGKLLGVPSVVYYSNESAGPVNWLAQRLATRYLVPDSFRGPTAHRVERVASFQEWAYTSPDRYVPAVDVRGALGLREDERYFVVRLVSWQSIHDVDAHGIDDPRRLIDALRPFGRVFVSSERPLPPDLAEHALRLPVERMIDVLAQADLYVGESVTMATEAAMLGTPSVYVSDSFRGVSDALQKEHGLCLNFLRLDEAMPDILALAADAGAKATWGERRAAFARRTEDFTTMILDRVDAVMREHAARRGGARA